MKVRDVLYLVMSALRKLPATKGMMLYRGIHGKVELSQYKEGSTVTWPRFSSTSPNMNVTKNFMEKMIKEHESSNIKRSNNDDNINKDVTLKGALFIIEDAWGYRIQPYSLYSEEEEILLEPEREFKVTSIVDSNEFLMINLKMLDTPLILTRIFGKGRNN